MRHRIPTLAALAITLAATGAAAQDIAAADMVDRDGDPAGSAFLRATASGQTLVSLALTGLPEGELAVHLHETGDCSADDFSSAGGHVADGASHGIASPDGPHPGDLPNLVVGDDGIADVHYFKPTLQIERHIFDPDGAALIVHAGPDDYATQPAGAAGPRIACGEFVRRVQTE